MRYFYDGTHFRNNAGEMICARMTGRTDLWIPDDFGTYVTADTPEDYFLNVLSPKPLSAGRDQHAGAHPHVPPSV